MEENEKNCGHDCDCDHDHDDGCGCENNTIFITFDDDKEVECNIIGIFDFESKDFIAINPIDGDEVLIYEYIETEEGMQIEFIDSDEQYNKVTERFYELFEGEDDDFVEYEEYAEDDDLVEEKDEE